MHDDFWKSLAIRNSESDGWPSRVIATGGSYLGTGRILFEWSSRLEILQAVPGDFGEAEAEQKIRDSIMTFEMPNTDSFPYPLKELWFLHRTLVKKDLFLMILFECFRNLRNLEVSDLEHPQLECDRSNEINYCWPD